MEDARKRAYRLLLSHAMLDIRFITWAPYGLRRWLSPGCWRKHIRWIRRSGELADRLHNLAWFAAYDFEGFDEDWFWRDIERADRRQPELRLSDYRGIFEQYLSEPPCGGGTA